MKGRLTTDLGHALFGFFQEYLPTQRGVSVHTLRSYRNSVLLLLRHMSEDTHRRIEALQLSDLNAERVTRFLRYPHRCAEDSKDHASEMAGALASPELQSALIRLLRLVFRLNCSQVPATADELAELRELLDLTGRLLCSEGQDFERDLP